MKALLDASFLRHLNLVNGIRLIEDITNNLGWEFRIPQIVVDELNRRNIERPLRALMNNGIVQTDSCTDKEFSSIKQSILGLDDGELEAICIVNKCSDRKFRRYVILTDDKPAQRKASNLGMSSLDVVTFLFHANQNGILDSKNSLQAISILKQNAYYIEKAAQQDFERRLI